MFKLGKTVLKIPTSDWDTQHQSGLTFWRDTMLSIKAWAKVLCSKKATGKLLMQTLCWLTAKHTRCLFILVCATECIWQMVCVCVRMWYVQCHLKTFLLQKLFLFRVNPSVTCWPIYLYYLPAWLYCTVETACLCVFLLAFVLVLSNPVCWVLEVSKAWLSAL